ncbi:hypothetical protein GOV05_04170 [Candidatus Woesearchaeota archaeon]|nr:hypothetical protein [Candidatus Woesearchaeota archaeon]
MKKDYVWLNSKEVKRIKKSIDECYGLSFDTSKYALCLSPKNKIYLINRDVDKIDLGSVKINTIGLYFAESKGGELRLSMDGAMMIGRNATKNVVELSSSDSEKWLRGYDLDLEGEHKGFVIIKNSNGDVLGCSKHKNGKLMNFTPKERRIKSSD